MYNAYSAKLIKLLQTIRFLDLAENEEKAKTRRKT